jgi:hypothetical protein
MMEANASKNPLSCCVQPCSPIGTDSDAGAAPGRLGLHLAAISPCPRSSRRDRVRADLLGHRLYRTTSRWLSSNRHALPLGLHCSASPRAVGFAIPGRIQQPSSGRWMGEVLPSPPREDWLGPDVFLLRRSWTSAGIERLELGSPPSTDTLDLRGANARQHQLLAADWLVTHAVPLGDTTQATTVCITLAGVSVRSLRTSLCFHSRPIAQCASRRGIAALGLMQA